MFSQREKERMLEVFIYEQNRVQNDDPLYFQCIRRMEAANVCCMTTADTKIIWNFIITWGGMRRTGKGANIPKTGGVIEKYGNFLQRARRQDLHGRTLQVDRQTIEDLFDDLYPLVGAISSAKILHLICPGFFPLWDQAIINGYNSSYKAKHGSPLVELVRVPNTTYGKRASGRGYYDFMEFTRAFIGKHHHQLTQIQAALKNAHVHNYEKSLLKLVDEFNMHATHVPFYYFV